MPIRPEVFCAGSDAAGLFDDGYRPFDRGLNNAHILSLLSYTDKTTGRLHLIIKIDLEDVSPVIRSFERFNYTVLYYFMEKGMVDDLLQQRMEELVRYMNI